MTNEISEKLFNILLDISKNLEPISFWKNYVFWSVVVLAITLFWLIRYTRATEKMKDEIIRQTELGTMPLMCLYVRYISGIKDAEERLIVGEKYSITHETNHGIVPSPYYFSLRNMGNGPAFNVEIESENFKADKYQTRVFAPVSRKDEHAVRVVIKPSNKIRSIDDLEGEVFTIKCQSVLGKKYDYKYKIINITQREVEFMNPHD